MNTGIVKTVMLAVVLALISGCAATSSYTTSTPLLSAAELESMITVTVRTIEPQPDAEIAVAAIR